MSKFKQFIADFKRNRAKHLIAERRKRVNHHVYTQAEILSNNTTRVWICIDGVRIMLISNMRNDYGSTPCVSLDDADKFIDFVKRQYYLVNRHRVLRYEQSQR